MSLNLETVFSNQLFGEDDTMFDPEWEEFHKFQLEQIDKRWARNEIQNPVVYLHITRETIEQLEEDNAPPRELLWVDGSLVALTD